MDPKKILLTNDDVRVLLSAVLEWEHSRLEKASQYALDTDGPCNSKPSTTAKILYNKLASCIEELDYDTLQDLYKE